ncbi:conjugal transfer protein [Streptomyces griseus]|uniref:conjugal transfer protein n=1 Tax=Streptomyces griseus TaxID=1911 RepID=UPI003328CC37
MVPSLGAIARKIAGLPEPRPPEPETDPVQARAAVWEAAGAELAAQQRGGGPVAPPPPRTPPWVVEPEKSGSVAARRLGRGLVWGVLALAALTGIRSWVAPPTARVTPPAAPAEAAPAYPEAAAQAVAARLARAYLTWDADAPDVRAAQLAAVLPPGADTAMGWDGDGRQTVAAVEPGTVTPGPRGRARVRVDVLLATPGTGAPARWVGLDVPVARTTGDRVVVTGQPGLTGVPATGPRPPAAAPAPVSDTDLSRTTESAVAQFLAALTTGDTATVTAPGAQIPPLPDGIEFRSLDAWAIDQTEKAGDRTGTALVTWEIGGATIQQTYRVVLTRVSSASAARWQVAALHGGDHM